MPWLVGGLSVVAAAALVPFWAPLLLAAWGAIIAWPLQQRLARSLRGSKLSAGLLTALLVLLILLPVLSPGGTAARLRAAYVAYLWKRLRTPRPFVNPGKNVPFRYGF